MKIASSLTCVGPNGKILRFENPPALYPVNRYQSLWLASSAYCESLNYCEAHGVGLGDLRVWEPCCGGGGVAVFLKAAGAGFVRATDINRNALEACRHNAHINGVQIDEIDHADLLAGVPHNGFDLIVCNPPCRPTGMLGQSTEPAIRAAMDGGRDGVEFTLALIRDAKDHLVAGGRLIFVLVSTGNYERVCEALDRNFNGAWRASVNSPVAQPFLADDERAIEEFIDARRQRRAFVWYGTDQRLWRFSWVVVATKTESAGEGGCRSGLYFHNHSHDIEDPDYLKALALFNRDGQTG